jgi:hypothetical protein
MAPIVLLRLFRADGDFNQATPHPADPIKCRTSTQRTQAPESVDTGRASRLDPLENTIDVNRTLRIAAVASQSGGRPVETRSGFSRRICITRFEHAATAAQNLAASR